MTKKPFRKTYRKYLGSKEWAEKRAQVIFRDRGNCTICRVKMRGLQVHHKTYVRFGNELLEDLTTLCPACHEAVHKSSTIPRENNYG